MKIVFFARLFYPHVGGVEKHVLEISKSLIKKDHSVTVITENYQSLSSTAKIEGINIVRINVGKNDWYKKFRIWRELFNQIQIIRSADIIHSHDVFFWYLPFRFIFPNKKVYTTFHGYEGNKIPNFKTNFMFKLSETLSNGNICIGNFYKKWFGINATIVSYGAVDEGLIKIGKSNYKPTKEAMYLGRLEKEAGIMEYLKAVKDTNIVLDVFGDGSQRKQAEMFVKNNNLNVNFKGFVANATDYIKDYKYIFTSRYLGILEAMALKKPVFAVYNNKIKKDYLTMTPFSEYIYISKDGNGVGKQLVDFDKEKSKISKEKSFNWIKNQTWKNMVKIYSSLWGKM